MLHSRRHASLLLILVVLVGAVLSQNDGYGDYGDYQDYQDYADGYGDNQDNLYHDYAERQYNKNQGGGGGAVVGMGKVIMFSTLSWIVGGRIHSRGAVKKLKTKFQREQKALYSQYYNDVYKLTEQNNKIQTVVEKLEKALKETKEKAELEAIQRDYEEFKQPDIDGDDRISRAEFNMYVKNYLSNYPGLQEKDYPKFEDFDHDNDGYVGFKEYAEQMALQVQKAELAQHQAQQKETTTTTKQKKKTVQEMYQDNKKGKSFEDLYGSYR